MIINLFYILIYHRKTLIQTTAIVLDNSEKHVLDLRKKYTSILLQTERWVLKLINIPNL